jgi:hypothetical protein
MDSPQMEIKQNGSVDVSKMRQGIVSEAPQELTALLERIQQGLRLREPLWLAFMYVSHR